MKKLADIFGYGLDDTLTIFDDGYLHKGVVTLYLNDGESKPVRMAVNIDKLIITLENIKLDKEN